MSCNCDTSYERLRELLDRECDPERREQLLADIQRCPGCVERLRIETDVRQLVRSCCCAQAPTVLRERISITIQTIAIESDS
ncbi:mycothiol system anti-sigma-R factor [Corynebacterium argentoratense]|uniref:mycothiol system anti-sigma-R factor n=1 Tax=Corynebacterium argentoratense TaxID=42817 RepID=UPI001F31A128|nr:mycothiol system anti-sigma-R factor [Corynebacterium argentoratense]MCF1712815.1 mycothiol system anti-sigma-R factor [Corynebacterium argentoratense]